MKKFFTLLMLACGITVSAQNIQLHYDFGSHIYTDEEDDRQKVTPAEMSRPFSMQGMKVPEIKGSGLMYGQRRS